MSVFDKNDSTRLSSIWIDFLKQTAVNCPVTSTSTSIVNPAGGNTASTAPPVLSCKTPQFWSLQFDTPSLENTFGITSYNVGQSVALSLSPRQTPSPSIPGLGSVLGSFGVLPDGTGDWGSGALVNTIISTIADGLASLSVDNTSGTRNLMWLTPGQTMKVDTALEFVPSPASPTDDGSDALNKIKTAVLQNLGLGQLGNISNLKILVQRTCYGTRATNSAGNAVWFITKSFRVTFRIAFGGLWFWINHEPGGMSISVTPNRSGDNFWSNLDSLHVPGISSSSNTPSLSGILSDHVTLLNLSIGKNNSGVWWKVNVALQWKRSQPGQVTPAQIYLSYDSQSSTFSGGLVTTGFYSSVTDKLLPIYVPGRDITQPDGMVILDAWDVKNLCSEADNFPQGLPTTIALAELDFITGTPACMSLTAKLISPPRLSNDHHVPFPIEWNELDIDLFKSGDGFYFSASAFFTLNGTQYGLSYPPAQLGLNVNYDSSGPTYQLTGYVENLHLGLLAGFFDPQYRDPLISVVGKLNIATLQVMYTYNSGLASSFCFNGVVQLGPLQLRMFYQYVSSKAGTSTAAKSLLPKDGPDAHTIAAPTDGTVASNWFLEFDLEASNADATIGNIVAAISDDADGSLPSFVSGIKIPTTGGRSPVSIKIAKTDAGQVVFVLRIVIEMFTLTFFQIATKKVTPNDKAKPTKRLLRFAVDRIPLIDKVPLLNQLPQPFDQLEYYWVNGEPGGKDGFLESEVKAINESQVVQGQDALLFKAISGPVKNAKTGGPVAGPAPDNVVIQCGHHFIVVQNNAVVIDHVFNATPEPASGAPAAPAGSAGDSGNKPRPPDPAPSAPAKGAIAVKQGPLSITAITLQYKEQHAGGQKILSLVIDATFRMGPMSFSLLGFSIGIPLTGNVTLQNLGSLASSIVVNLQGLALGFNNPPLLLAGGFEHQYGADGSEIFLGGIGISFPPYTFVGIGEYKILNNYKSVFIYAKLDGPIVTLEFATISGLRLGFGYNSVVRSPTGDQITEFPFINDAGTSGAGNDPMALLKSLVETPADQPWVTAKQDSYWFAAGMSITAFDILSVTAVAMFAFRDSGPVITIFADAVAQMPPGVKERSEMIAYVELGMVAEMNFVDGYFRVEASLAPTSFLLVPQCHIYGGFALVYWFAPNEHAGDWVFSIGGYHPNYVPPAWYPVPKRLGISFNIGILQITGEAYFAVTPKCAMGGATTHVSLSFGPIEAWYDSSMDALVNFHPLHYIVDFAVSIGVSFNIDVWFIHIHVSASVGAWVHIEGPEFGGSARVDFYLFGFTVDFGATNSPPDPLDLLEFWEMLHKPGPSSAPLDQGADTNPVQSYLIYNEYDNTGKALSKSKNGTPLPISIPKEGAGLKFILENGNYPMPSKPDPTPQPSSTAKPPNTGTGAKWFVRGGSFAFRIASDFAMSNAIINPHTTNVESQVITPPTSTQSIHARPMRVTESITSTLTITIKEKDSPYTVIGSWTSVNFALKPVPSAAWGVYSRDVDPMFTRHPKALLNADKPTVDLATALMVAAPLPELAVSTIPVFKATAAAKFGVLDFRTDTVNGTDWLLADTLSIQTAYLASNLTDEEQTLVVEGEMNKLWEKRGQDWVDGAKKMQMDVQVGLVKEKFDLTELLIQQVTDVMGWGVGRLQTEKVLDPPVWKLKGGLPTKLVRNLKGEYLALPRMGVVA